MPINIKLPKNHIESMIDAHPEIVSRKKCAMNTHAAIAMSMSKKVSPVKNM